MDSERDNKTAQKLYTSPTYWKDREEVTSQKRACIDEETVSEQHKNVISSKSQRISSLRSSRTARLHRELDVAKAQTLIQGQSQTPADDISTNFPSEQRLCPGQPQRANTQKKLNEDPNKRAKYVQQASYNQYQQDPLTLTTYQTPTMINSTGYCQLYPTPMHPGMIYPSLGVYVPQQSHNGPYLPYFPLQSGQNPHGGFYWQSNQSGFYCVPQSLYTNDSTYKTTYHSMPYMKYNYGNPHAATYAISPLAYGSFRPYHYPAMSYPTSSTQSFPSQTATNSANQKFEQVKKQKQYSSAYASQTETKVRVQIK